MHQMDCFKSNKLCHFFNIFSITALLKSHDLSLKPFDIIGNQYEGTPAAELKLLYFPFGDKGWVVCMYV
jgi:hypothetical protein